MSALLEFMYKGEVHVSQESLNSFLKAAESLQVKGLSTEHGRLAAAPNSNASTALDNMNSLPVDATPPPQTTTGGGAGGRRGGGRNSNANNANSLNANCGAVGTGNGGGGGGSGGGGGGSGGGALKQECDSLMHPSGSFNPYISPIYRPSTYDPLRKKHLKSPYGEAHETRGSVLRDGSKSAAASSVGGDSAASPVSRVYHRPGSSASSTGPVDSEAMQVDRFSPNQSRYIQ